MILVVLTVSIIMVVMKMNRSHVMMLHKKQLLKINLNRHSVNIMTICNAK